MSLEINKSETFYKKLARLSREELIELIQLQDADLVQEIYYVEKVFQTRMSHLNWPDGTPILSRPFTNEELAYLIDQPFDVDPELTKIGLSINDQQNLHYSRDAVLWAKHYLKATPRIYQILMIRHPNRFKVLRAGRRLGKRLDINTPIMTTFGWSTMGKLQEGDKVFDEKGRECNVTYVSPINAAEKSYKVMFSDGSFLLADADHQWIVDTKASRKASGRSINPVAQPIQVTTQDMINLGLKTKVYTNQGGMDKYESSFSIRVCEPLQHEQKQLPIDPYILGLYLGDGGSNTYRMTTADKEIVAAFDIAGYTLKHYRKYDYNFVDKNFWIKFKSLGLKNNKHIPEIYMIASVNQREELLKGLMDSDGYCDPRTKCCEFTQKNTKLALQVKSLIESLGYRTQLRQDPARLYGKDCGIRNRISFTPWRSVFNLPRKLKNQTIKPEPSGWQKHRYIIDIIPIDSIEMRCIEVDSHSHLYLAGENYIPTHNTHALAIMLLHYSWTNNYGHSLIVTPMKTQAGLIYDEMLKLAKKSDIVFDSITRNVRSPQHEIGFSNGSTCRFFTSGMKTGAKADITRGQEAHFIVLDELDFMGDDDLDALLAMLQQTEGNQEPKRLIGASTPSGRRSTFYTWCYSKRFKEFWFPSFANPYWSDEDEEFYREFYTETGFRHEIEADWGEDAEGVYPRKYVDIAFREPGWKYVPQPDYMNNSIYVAGVDWDKYGAGVNIVVLEKLPPNHPDPTLRNKVKLYFREEMAKDEYAFLKAVDYVVSLDKSFNFKHLYVDAGSGEMQWEMFRKYGMDHPETGLTDKTRRVSFAEAIEVRDPFTMQKIKKQIKPFMVDNLRQMLEKEYIIFPASDEELYMQLISYIVSRTTPTGIPVFEISTKNVYDHAHDALILACLAITENYGDLMHVNYATKSFAISNETFLSTLELSADPALREVEKEIIEDTWGGPAAAPVQIRRDMTYNRRKGSRPFTRRMF